MSADDAVIARMALPFATKGRSDRGLNEVLGWGVEGANCEA